MQDIYAVVDIVPAVLAGVALLLAYALVLRFRRRWSVHQLSALAAATLILASSRRGPPPPLPPPFLVACACARG